MAKITDNELENVSGGAGRGLFAYTVVYGDTLGAIAKRFDTNVNTIIALNKLRNPDRIDVGQVLLIPTSKKSGWV